MGVNTKMTALANEVRALSGGTIKVGIDDMTTDLNAANSEVNSQTDIIALIKETVNTLPDNKNDEKMVMRPFTTYTDNTFSCIGYGAFAYHNTLTSVTFTSCLSIGILAFAYCSSLTTVSFPSCTNIPNYAFSSCAMLSSIYFPECSRVRYAFVGCNALVDISLPKVQTVDDGAFMRCAELSELTLPSTLTKIGVNSFNSCKKLINLTLLGSTVASLANINAFTNTPMSSSALTGSFGSIYVPASLVDSYKSATNWATYADRITAITEG